jgi:hypothetical protein
MGTLPVPLYHKVGLINLKILDLSPDVELMTRSSHMLCIKADLARHRSRAPGRADHAKTREKRSIQLDTAWFGAGFQAAIDVRHQVSAL